MMFVKSLMKRKSINAITISELISTFTYVGNTLIYKMQKLSSQTRIRGPYWTIVVCV
jgi:hypothetical protein